MVGGAVPVSTSVDRKSKVTPDTVGGCADVWRIFVGGVPETCSMGTYIFIVSCSLTEH
jgi:hypothetical protein